ncbi:hypothetical protein E3T55_16565 [Cryobacterium frigoriphilum]|uniref:Uncharacterized protein n=1 Tax=Cryobacterium frigoriphilum TaxID=1259150 RepID=A0A4R8ZV95_9MICO|nr:hypothetical protein [Cryobacterium frigoriphilum]TFD46979.1 hypothetical protein E3T55_16565 [Cryobacterium frigoriphilum]
MSTPVLATKLFIAARRPETVARPHLMARLQQALDSGRKLTVIAAAAGSGKNDSRRRLDHHASQQ